MLPRAPTCSHVLWCAQVSHCSWNLIKFFQGPGILLHNCIYSTYSWKIPESLKKRAREKFEELKLNNDELSRDSEKVNENATLPFFPRTLGKSPALTAKSCAIQAIKFPSTGSWNFSLCAWKTPGIPSSLCCTSKPCMPSQKRVLLTESLFLLTHSGWKNLKSCPLATRSLQSISSRRMTRLLGFKKGSILFRRLSVDFSFKLGPT